MLAECLIMPKIWRWLIIMGAVMTPINDNSNETSVELGQDILGIALNCPDIAFANKDIRSDYFLEPVHGAIWEGISRQFSDGSASVSALASNIERGEFAKPFQDLGGLRFLTDLAAKSPPATALSNLKSELIQSYKLREMARIGLELASQSGRPIDQVLKDIDQLKALTDCVHSHESGRFRLEFLTDINLQPEEWLVDGLLPIKGIGFLAGPSGSGKSFVAIDWAMSIAYSLPILWRPSKQVGCLYIAAEGANGVRKRLLAWCKRHRLDLDKRLALIGDPPDLLKTSDIDALIKASKEATEGFDLLGLSLGLIIIDTFSQATSGADENAAMVMTVAIRNAQKLSEETGAFVLIVHHTGKDFTKGLRGHSSLNAAADTVIMIEHENNQSTRKLTVTKQKDGEDGFEIGFGLESVGFEHNGSGYDSCVVDYLAVPPSAAPRAKKLNSFAEILKTTIGYLSDNGKAIHAAPLEAGVVSGQMALLKSEVKETAISRGLASEDEAEGTVRKRYDRAIADLVTLGIIRTSGKYLWLL